MTPCLLEMCPYYFLHVPVFPIAKQPVFIEYECVFLCRNRTQAAVMKPFLWITSVRRFETFIWDKSSHQILPAPTDFTDHWIVLNKSKKTHLFFLQNVNIISWICRRYLLLPMSPPRGRTEQDLSFDTFQLVRINLIMHK